jgi:hypothetical protein
VLLFYIAAIHHFQAAADAQQHGSLDGGTQCNRLLRVNLTPAGKQQQWREQQHRNNVRLGLADDVLDSFMASITTQVICQELQQLSALIEQPLLLSTVTSVLPLQPSTVTTCIITNVLKMPAMFM